MADKNYKSKEFTFERVAEMSGKMQNASMNIVGIKKHK
jgi:hypothetical protein